MEEKAGSVVDLSSLDLFTCRCPLIVRTTQAETEQILNSINKREEEGR